MISVHSFLGKPQTGSTSLLISSVPSPWAGNAFPLSLCGLHSHFFPEGLADAAPASLTWPSASLLDLCDTVLSVQLSLYADERVEVPRC